MVKQIWPCCKKVKRQHRTIILAILVDLLSRIICAKTALIWFWRRRFLKVFTIYGHGSHLGQLIMTILAIFRSLVPRRLHMKFEQHWPRGFRGGVIWNYQHLFHTNVWRPYKCIGKQTWPHRLFVLRFYGPVNPMGLYQARSVYLTTHLLSRLSPLSG